MSYDITKSFCWIVSDLLVVSTASAVCLVSYAGSFWPVVSTAVGALGCGLMVKQSCKVGFNIDGVLGRVISCFACVLLSISTFYYVSATADFYSCITGVHSEAIVYDANDQCNLQAKIDLSGSCMLFGVGFACLVVSFAINIINDCRRGLGSYGLLL